MESLGINLIDIRSIQLANIPEYKAKTSLTACTRPGCIYTGKRFPYAIPNMQHQGDSSDHTLDPEPIKP